MWLEKHSNFTLIWSLRVGLFDLYFVSKSLSASSRLLNSVLWDTKEGTEKCGGRLNITGIRTLNVSFLNPFDCRIVLCMVFSSSKKQKGRWAH